jgi:flagellar biosynthesis/type III secretory pathway protein FliH
LDRLATDWIDNTSLVVQVARAQISALRTASDPDGRFDAKTQLVRNLYTMGYSSDTIREAFRLIDWMMRLRSDLDRRFTTELIAFEEELRMPFVTSVERVILERGREEGREEGFVKGCEQGGVSLLLRQMARLCGPLPESVEQEIRSLSLDQIQNLGEALLEFHSLEDLKNGLKTMTREIRSNPDQ